MFGLENTGFSSLNPFKWFEKYKEVKEDFNNLRDLAREAGDLKEKVGDFLGKASQQTDGLWGNLESIKDKVCEFFGSEWMGRNIIPLAIGAILAVGAAWFGLSRKTDDVAQNTFKNVNNEVGETCRRRRKGKKVRSDRSQLSPQQLQRRAEKKRERAAKKLNFTQPERVKAYLDQIEVQDGAINGVERTHLHLTMATRASRQVDRIQQRLKLSGADRDAALFEAGLIQESLDLLYSDKRFSSVARQQIGEIHKRLERLVKRVYEMESASAKQVYQQEHKFRSTICNKYQLLHVPVPGDGNCLFSSAVKEIQRTHPERYQSLLEKAQTADLKELAKVLRRETFDYMEANLQKNYKDQILAELQAQAVELAQVDNSQLETLLRRLPDALAVKLVNLRAIFQTEGKKKFEEALHSWLSADAAKVYLSSMKHSRAYAGSLELQAIAEMEGQPIRVFTNQFDGEYIDVVPGNNGQQYDPDHTLHLYRPKGIAHYDALQPIM